MDITFANGKMFVEHPSGHVDTFEPEDLQSWLESANDNEVMAKAEVETIEGYIANLNATI